MTAFDAAFQHRLMQKLEELANERMQHLADGAWSATLADIAVIGGEYRYRVGYLRALTDVLKLCEDVNAEIMRD